MSFCGKHESYRHYHFSLCLSVVLLVAATAAEDPSAILSRFQQYLQINTAQPQPNYYEAAEFITSQAKSLSLESQTLEFVKGKPLILIKWAGKEPTLPSILLNSHTDVVPSEHQKWIHPPFSGHLDSTTGNIFARGSQDMKCVGLQYLEAIRKLKASGFIPLRTVYLSFVPDEEIGGNDGAGKFADSDVFAKMNVGIVLDEGLASPTDNYRAFYGERSPWWLVVKAVGAPGHGAKLYDNTAMENLLKSIETIRRFRAAQFDLVKAGLKDEGEVISVNMVFLKAGTPSPSFKHKVSVNDKFGKPAVTAVDNSNIWWALFEEAVIKANASLGKPEVFPASTDMRYFRKRGLPAIGFSPMANTPILLHDHNEFLNKDEYLKGIDVYESIIKTYASHIQHPRDDASREEL
ncbi:unnamed protein product [Withania somnifera]